MRTSILSAILFLAASTLPAQIDSVFSPPKQELVKLSGTIDRGGRGVVTATIETGWHIQSAHPLDTFTIPTTLSVDGLVQADYPPHEVKSFTFSGGTKLAVYEGTIKIPFTAKLKSGATTVTASLHYQACNDKVCLPPRTATTEIALSGAPVAPSAAFTPLSAAPKDRLTSTFLSHGLPLTLLVLFLGGRRFALSAAYVAGLVIMYSALGVLAALSGKIFGSWLQHPAVLIALAVLMLVLASSMFGAWEMTVPQFIGRRSGGRAGLAGAGVMDCSSASSPRRVSGRLWSRSSRWLPKSENRSSASSCSPPWPSASARRISSR